MAQPLNPPATDEQNIFLAVLKHVIWYSVAAIAIAIIGRFFWWPGVILFAVFALVAGVTVLHTLRGIGIGFIAVSAAFRARVHSRSGRFEGQLYMIAAILMQVCQVAVYTSYILFLYRTFFRNAGAA